MKEEFYQRAAILESDHYKAPSESDTPSKNDNVLDLREEDFSSELPLSGELFRIPLHKCIWSEQ
jgi:hypothetical protein